MIIKLESAIQTEIKYINNRVESVKRSNNNANSKIKTLQEAQTVALSLMRLLIAVDEFDKSFDKLYKEVNNLQIEISDMIIDLSFDLDRSVK